MVVLSVLGAVAAMWGVFQWAELLLARAGSTPFCAINATFDCTRVWDSGFASAIHGATGVPIAGWGVVWGVLALLAPLLVLYRSARGSAIDVPLTATVLAAAGGMATVVVMVAVSISIGAACLSCTATYVVVGIYAAVALTARPFPRLAWRSGVLLTAGVVAVAYGSLLVPGLRTPHGGDAADREAFAAAARAAGPVPPAASSPTAPAPAQPSPAGGGTLEKFLSGLPAPMRQGVADSLAAYRESPRVAVRPPRVLLGPAGARVRVTEFTDVLCGHCAALHQSLDELRSLLPDGALAIESRQFPLDRECNPHLASEPKLPVRCAAAKVRICLEEHPRAFELAGALFEHQRDLSVDRVYEIAAPYMDREHLEVCVASPQTEAKLADDLTWARQHRIDGTPLVLLNGRKSTGFGPFIYALALSGPNPDHPAFATLPPPRSHDGHDHTGHAH